MGNVSVEWLAAISTGREYSIDEKKKGYAVPVTPWLHPPVGKRLRSLIIKLGTVRELERQEILYPQDRKVSDIVLVQQGVTARQLWARCFRSQSRCYFYSRALCLRKS